MEWKGKPYQATKDDTIKIGTENFKVRQGDWLCNGIWMEKLVGGRNWHTFTVNEQECVVKLETVLNANLDMRQLSEDNPLPLRMKKKGRDIANERGAWRMSDGDHAFLMEESRNREMNNEYDEEAVMEVREEAERRKKWSQATANDDVDSEDDDDELLNIRGGGEDEGDEYDMLMGQFSQPMNFM